MEDQERGMETGERVTTQPKKKRKIQKGLTIMVIRRVGKVRSFELSGRSVILVVIFLILFIPSSIFLSNSYFQLHQRYAERTHELQQAKEALDKAEKDIFEAKRHYESLLYDSANNLQKEEVSSDQPSVEKAPPADEKKKHVPPAQEVPAKKSVAIKKPSIDPSPSPDNDRNAETKEVVDIKELTFHREGSYIDVDFKIVNLNPQEGNSLGGYVHIIAETWDTFPPQIWTSPKETLKNGYPINFRRGELFIIKRFKPINRRIDLLPSTDEPAIIRVLIYNQAGELKLEKEFEVTDEA